jgi:hypothetical protein
MRRDKVIGGAGASAAIFADGGTEVAVEVAVEAEAEAEAEAGALAKGTHVERNCARCKQLGAIKRGALLYFKAEQEGRRARARGDMREAAATKLNLIRAQFKSSDFSGTAQGDVNQERLQGSASCPAL